jgi:hypothetical protein
MLHRGVSLIGVMHLHGHKTPRMTLLYIQITQADLQREFLQACRNPRHHLPPPPIDSTLPGSAKPTVIEAFPRLAPPAGQ